MNELILSTSETAADLIRLKMSFAPLYKNKLSDDERGNEYEYHLGVHRLMTTMFLMHPCMLHPATQTPQHTHTHTPYLVLRSALNGLSPQHMAGNGQLTT